MCCCCCFCIIFNCSCNFSFLGSLGGKLFSKACICFISSNNFCIASVCGFAPCTRAPCACCAPCACACAPCLESWGRLTPAPGPCGLRIAAAVAAGAAVAEDAGAAVSPSPGLSPFAPPICCWL